MRNKAHAAEYRKEYLQRPHAIESNRQRASIWRRNNTEQRILQDAKTRAKRKNIDFNLLLEDIVVPQVCPILGIPLYRSPTNRACPNSPSLDRIDCSEGYTKNNVQVISWRANDLKRDATLEEIEKLYVYMVKECKNGH